MRERQDWRINMLLQYYHTKELVDAPVKLQGPEVVTVPISAQQLHLQGLYTPTMYWSDTL
jgi:hypothetical protein